MLYRNTNPEYKFSKEEMRQIERRIINAVRKIGSVPKTDEVLYFIEEQAKI